MNQSHRSESVAIGLKWKNWPMNQPHAPPGDRGEHSVAALHLPQNVQKIVSSSLNLGLGIGMYANDLQFITPTLRALRLWLMRTMTPNLSPMEFPRSSLVHPGATIPPHIPSLTKFLLV